METNSDGSGLTTFTVDQGESPESAFVTIAAEVSSRSGIRGLPERVVLSVALPRIYRKELARLSEYVARRQPAEGAGRPASGRS